MTSLLSVSDLSRAFGGVAALQGVSFEVAPGEMLALIGPNGAGKSTCFNVIGGQIRPDSGRVMLDGADVTGLDPVRLSRRGIGRTFQTAAVFASMSVRECVQMSLISRAGRIMRLWEAADSHDRTTANRLLAQCGLTRAADSHAGALAYGDLKRLELAMALAASPRVLLMDEPTAGTGAAERRALMALIRGHATARRMAVLFTEHDMEAVFGHADRVLVLDHGALIAEGSPAAIRADARVRAVYLGG